jgi:hypothetical protein
MSREIATRTYRKLTHLSRRASNVDPVIAMRVE